MQEIVERKLQLSPQQRRVWRLRQEEDAASAYRCRCAVAVEGALERGALRSALRGVVGRYEVLRTAFPAGAAQVPSQLVVEREPARLAEHDLSDLAAGEQGAAVELFYDELGRHAFDLARGDVLRVTLLTLSPTSHVLMLAAPALCADAATLGIIVRELAASYDAVARGTEPHGEPLQYGVVSEWLNDLLDSEEAEEGRQFWRELCAGDFAGAKLPFESEPARGARFAPEHVSLHVGDELAGQVRAAAERAGTTESSFLLACWQALLWRLGGQPEVTVGVCFDGRANEELASAAGPLARFLPIRHRPEDDVRFSDLLRWSEAATKEAADWQECFDWNLLAGTSEEGEAPYTPFCFESERLERAHAGGVSFTVARQECDTDRFKLKLTARLSEVGLALEVRYDPASYGRGEAGLLGEYFCELVRSAAASTDCEVRRLELLDNKQLHRILVDWNETKADYEQCTPLHELFERQVERTPDATALVYEQERVTYRELNGRANRLARHLRGLGVGAESLVGVLMERSAEMVVSLLAVLKAGGAYVPLDPEYPAERVRFMLEDSRAGVLLTRRGLLDSLAGVAHETTPCEAAQVVYVEEEEPRLASTADAEAGGDLGVTVMPGHPAYVIYTSGSTGRPKGVSVPHRAITNHMLW
ncbi:MAG: condensation domain-containing protein, partial [Pyrinomonadaceae bacterium]